MEVAVLRSPDPPAGFTVRSTVRVNTDCEVEYSSEASFDALQEGGSFYTPDVEAREQEKASDNRLAGMKARGDSVGPGSTGVSRAKSAWSPASGEKAESEEGWVTNGGVGRGLPRDDSEEGEDVDGGIGESIATPADPHDDAICPRSCQEHSVDDLYA